MVDASRLGVLEAAAAAAVARLSAVELLAACEAAIDRAQRWPSDVRRRAPVR